MKTTDARYQVHGIKVRIAGPSEPAALFRNRLLSFERNYEGLPDIDVILLPWEGSGDFEHPQGKNIYDLEGGEVLYHAGTGTIRAAYQNSVRMICHPASGEIKYWIAADEQAHRVASHILFTLPLIEVLRHRDLYNIHAAGLCRDEQAVMLAGPSGAGKSTLALAMVRAGWAYMGDDMLFLKQDSPWIFGFPEGIDYFPDHAANSLKTNIRPDAVFGSPEVLQARPQALIFPRVAFTVQSGLHPMTASDAFLELAPNVLMSNRQACETHFRVLEDLTRRIPAFRLYTGTDLAAAERTISNLLTGILSCAA